MLLSVMMIRILRLRSASEIWWASCFSWRVCVFPTLKWGAPCCHWQWKAQAPFLQGACWQAPPYRPGLSGAMAALCSAGAYLGRVVLATGQDATEY